MLEPQWPSHAPPTTPNNAPPGRKRLNRLEAPSGGPALLMDRDDEDQDTRQWVLDRGFTPGVLPKRNRVAPWKDDQALYQRSQ